jgi:HEPN domain-containing protein
MTHKAKGKIPGSPEAWISSAQSDLRLARLAADDAYVRPEQACFHLQQAAEKAIKAVLLLSKVDFPLTHDIEELLEITRTSGIDLPEEVQEAGLLSPYAVETRYPGHWFEITPDDIQEARKVAEATVSWANEHLADAIDN